MLETNNANPGKDANESRLSGDRVEQTAAAHVRCSVCSSTFRRPEHLKRHLRSHTKEKPFECAQCGRHFSRTDTLHRHELSHHPPADEGGKGRAPRITVKTFRACRSCAAARVRCSGGAPCGRCDNRSLQCQYPTTRRSKPRTRGAALGEQLYHGEHDVTHAPRVPRSSSPQLSGIHAGPMQIDTVASRQTSLSGRNMRETPTTPEVSVPRPDVESSSISMHAREIPLSLNSPSWDQNMSSVLNWLPNQLLTSTPHQSDSVQSGTLTPGVLHMAGLSRVTQDLPRTSSDHSHGPEIDRPSQNMHTASSYPQRDRFIDRARGFENHRLDRDTSWHASDRTDRTSQPFPRTAAASEQPPESSRCRLDFRKAPESSSRNPSSQVFHPVRLIQVSTYDEIYRNFLLLCRNANPFFEIYDSNNFPSLDDCNYYFQCYFGSFQAAYPFLHLPTFNPNQCHWLLTLAIIGIGCNCSASRETNQYTSAFHEMTRRAIIVEKEKFDHNDASLDLMQATFLNCVGLLHSDNEKSHLIATSMFKDLVTPCRGRLLSPSPEEKLHRGPNESIWGNWVNDEVRRRTGYCIWLLDCAIAYYFDHRPSLSIGDAQASLPARERLWFASDAESWVKLWGRSKANHSLYDAVQILYIEKRLVSDIGWFNQNLLIHALYQRMEEVSEYFRRPLSFWNPSAKREAWVTAVPNGSVWLPGIPSYSKWRNSTCDCLDILDWTTKTSIASADPGRSVTVLELHLARLIMLAPFREIRSLATSMAMGKLQWSQREQTTEWQHLWRWTRNDQYKARLSIVHAGATLWHVRGDSTRASHEPFAVFLAVLTIWAFGVCHAYDDLESVSNGRPCQGEQPQGERSIQLDDPCSDEMVQRYVREGHLMQASIGNVGDICDNEGFGKILSVGYQRLSSLAAWGISKRFAMVLTRLAAVMAQQSETATDHAVHQDTH